MQLGRRGGLNAAVTLSLLPFGQGKTFPTNSLFFARAPVSKSEHKKKNKKGIRNGMKKIQEEDAISARRNIHIKRLNSLTAGLLYYIPDES